MLYKTYFLPNLLPPPVLPLKNSNNSEGNL